MNKFFDKTMADGIAEHESFMVLVKRINEDPSILDTLSYEMLVQVNAYYDKECRKLEERRKILEENLTSMKGELQEEGDDTQLNEEQ